MATAVVDFGKSEEKIVFHGSSKRDEMCSKAFWQSKHLVPHPETTLVVDDIKQRLRKAPPPVKSSKTLSYVPVVHSHAYLSFMAEADKMVRKDKKNVKDNLKRMRMEDLGRLHKAKDKRKERDNVSNHIGLKKQKSFEMINISEEYDVDDVEMDDAKNTIDDIERFERHHKVDLYIKDLPDEDPIKPKEESPYRRGSQMI